MDAPIITRIDSSADIVATWENNRDFNITWRHGVKACLPLVERLESENAALRAELAKEKERATDIGTVAHMVATADAQDVIRRLRAELSAHQQQLSDTSQMCNGYMTECSRLRIAERRARGGTIRATVPLFRQIRELRAELEAANKRADASAKTAIEVLGATACERNQEEIRALPFLDFCEQEIKRGCIRCMSEQLDEAREEALKARAQLLATVEYLCIAWECEWDELFVQQCEPEAHARIELARQEREADGN